MPSAIIPTLSVCTFGYAICLTMLTRLLRVFALQKTFEKLSFEALN